MRLASVGLPLVALLVVVPAAAEEPTSFEWIGEAVLPSDSPHSREKVGGLSSMGWDASAGELVVISDDRSEEGPARLYQIRVDLADGRLDPGDAEVVGRIELRDSSGHPFPPRSLDPEGLALADDRLWVGSEGEAKVGLAPFVAEFGRDGSWRRDLPLPERYRPDAGGTRGVRDNLGFESLSLAPGGRWLFAATENALAQDGPAADAGVASPARLLRWDLARPEALPAELIYRVEGLRITPPVDSAFRVNGLVDLLALSDTRLLALERQYVVGIGIAARLYLVDIEGADEVSARDSLVDPALVAVRKWLLLDFDDLGIRLDNLEAMALGPRLPDGRRALLVVSDDNFNPAEQVNQVLAFAVDTAPVTIAGIQGAGHRSPLEGRWVAPVEGMVTAIADFRGRRGFWMESFEPDADPATSEGLFVAWEGASTLGVGAPVRVGGRVAERAAREDELPVTTLELAALEELSGKVDLPEPVRLVDERPIPFWIDDDGLARFEPEADALDFWESVEGMRVEVPPGDVVGASRSFGELVLLPDGSPGPAWTSSGGVRLRPAGPTTGRIVLSSRLTDEDPEADVGARIEAPTLGVVDYSFSNYKVLALAAIEATAPAKPRCRERTALEGDARRLAVASFNVENLTAAGPPERFDRLAEVVVDALRSPAIVALEEVQDDSGRENDGTVTSRRTLDRLVRSIQSAGGPRYEPLWIDPEDGREGGQPGANIRVAALVDPLRVTVPRRGDAGARDAVEIATGPDGTRLEPNPGRIAPTSPAFSIAEGEGVRRSLAVEVSFEGKSLFLAVNHWSSKFGDDRDWGARQPPVKPTDALREAQSEVLREWAEALLALDPEARILILGDLNDFEWAPAITRLAAPPFENLIGRVFEPDRYTFNFEGVSQVLDHAVVSPALAEAAEIDIVHVNADCADVRRSSDHDPIVVRFDLR